MGGKGLARSLGSGGGGLLFDLASTGPFERFTPADGPGCDGPACAFIVPFVPTGGVIGRLGRNTCLFCFCKSVFDPGGFRPFDAFAGLEACGGGVDDAESSPSSRSPSASGALRRAFSGVGSGGVFARPGRAACAGNEDVDDDIPTSDFI